MTMLCASHSSYVELCFLNSPTMERVLVANLPPMTQEDLARFEKEGGKWGEQRSIRRNQLKCAVAGSAGLGIPTAIYATLFRRNTRLVGVSMFVLASVTGTVLGNYVGTVKFPSIASNGETTMMRRLWWAQKCMSTEK